MPFALVRFSIKGVIEHHMANSIWNIRNNFKLHEVALLMLEHDVDKYGANTENLLNNPPSGFSALYSQILEDACSRCGDEPSQENPEVEIPIYRLRTNKSENVEALNFNDGLMVSAHMTDIVAWIKRHNDYWGNPDSLDWAKKHNQNAYSPFPDKFFTVRPTELDSGGDLTTKERSTLLIIIAALAKEVKLDVSKASKTALLIEGMTQSIGCRISPTTIENKLKLIPDAMERLAK